MMKRITFLLLGLLPFAIRAQTTIITCADSTLKDIYHKCYDAYQPVCGCDNHTYRNRCAADYWGGLVTTHNYKPGICGNFDFDFVPNPVDAVASNNTSILNVYINDNLLQSTPVTAAVYVFDIFNRIKYSRNLIISSNDNFGQGQGTPVEDLNNDYFAKYDRGVYLLIVVVNGESKTKKIMKINIE